MPKGTLAVTDALSSLLASQLSVVQYGTAAAYEQIQEENAAYNRVVQDELATFAEMSEDSTRAYGGANVIDAEDMTEFDNVDASKIAAAYPVSFPLTRHGNKVGYTRDWLATNSTEQLAAQYLASRTGDQQRIQSKIRRALYYPVSRPVFLTDGTRNPAAYVDKLVPPNVPLPLYPLLNADGSPVPIGPNGETFNAATHTHYMAVDWTAGGSTATTRDGDLLAACANLTEHRVDGELRIIINAAEESKIRALPNFIQDYNPTVTVGANLTYAGNNLDVRNYNNRRIGTFMGFEVWVKPWAFPSYILAMATGGDMGERILVWRTRKGGLWSDFNFRAHQDNFPVTADPMTRDGDCSVWGRHLGVALFTGAATYAAPASY